MPPLVALAIERVGGDNVSGVLIGAPLSFVVPSQNAVAGGFGSSGIDLHVSAATSLFTDFEGTIYSDKSRTLTARGGIRSKL